MPTNIIIRRATVDDSPEIAIMAGELLNEISRAIGVQAFQFDLNDTTLRLRDFLSREKYFVFIAKDAGNKAIGFVTMYESHALYAEGAFGTLAELYVRPDYRSHNIGFRLLSQAKSFGVAQGWKRLEVTTPPLPQFNKTLAFYEREGFSVTGGRKLKVAL
ncbi:MAG: N-acetyltransferase family protein [Gammaproteobacteria bacterium]